MVSLDSVAGESTMKIIDRQNLEEAKSDHSQHN